VAAGGESIPRLYTRTGDRGTTGLAGGSRVEKDSPRIRAYGTYDELGALLGLVVTELPDELADIRELIRRLEHELFVAQAELATPSSGRPPSHRVEERHVQRLESDIDRFDDGHPAIHSFVLSGGSRPAAILHIARAVSRRAERELWALHRSEPQRPELLAWANRLSDLLFAVALVANHRLGRPEVPPDYSI
jgi:cob(I)alamin adenosyltransferase